MIFTGRYIRTNFPKIENKPTEKSERDHAGGKRPTDCPTTFALPRVGREGLLFPLLEVAKYSIGADRLRDIFYTMLALVLIAEFQAMAHLVVYDIGHPDTTRLGQFLQSGRDVDAVAENIGAFSHYVAEVHADSELHTFIFGHISVPLRHENLYRVGAGHGLSRAGEFDQQAVASSSDNSTIVFRDHAIGDDPVRP